MSVFLCSVPGVNVTNRRVQIENYQYADVVINAFEAEHKISAFILFELLKTFRLEVSINVWILGWGQFVIVKNLYKDTKLGMYR